MLSMVSVPTQEPGTHFGVKLAGGVIGLLVAPTKRILLFEFIRKSTLGRRNRNVVALVVVGTSFGQLFAFHLEPGLAGLTSHVRASPLLVQT